MQRRLDRRRNLHRQTVLLRNALYLDASLVASLDFIRLPTAALLAWIVFSEVPDIWTWIGGAIIAASSVYIARREAQLARERRQAAAKT